MGSTDTVSFKINGIGYTVNGESLDSRLVNYLHDNGLRGTHITCYEGGCGACVVVAKVPVPGSLTGETKTFSVNSCLTSLYGCNGWEITTIEGLGNQYDGFHPLQERLADYNGTQCGFCSPGMVMNMYGVTQSKTSWTDEDIESAFDGNICRCTGYRPILDAYKSVTPADIEDVGKDGKICSKGWKCCKLNKDKVMKPDKKEIEVAGKTWYQPTSLTELYNTLSGLTAGTNYALVCGNTSTALYNDGPYSVYINTTMVPELYAKSSSTNSLTLGANVSIATAISEFESLSSSSPSNFGYLAEVAKHWQHVANNSIRNLGSVGGNLIMRSKHPEFPSDIFLTLLAAGATVTVSNLGITGSYDLEEMLSVDFSQSKNILTEIFLAPLPTNSVYRTFKVMPRGANSRAYVGAAFCIQFDTTNGFTVTGSPIITYIGISSTFIRASATEAYIVGKNLGDVSVLQNALTVLDTEVVPEANYEDPSPTYRLSVAQNLFYKYVLGIIGDAAAPEYISGSADLVRAPSSGIQTYDDNAATWPLGQPLPKLDSKLHASGEAEYVKTMKPFDGELVGMFVQSTQANARIVSIDTTNALSIPGVVGFVGVEDITGVNNIIYLEKPSFYEELFPSDRVGYYGQHIGLIVATSREAAYAGVSAVNVEYEDEQPLILNLEDALNQGSTDTDEGFDYIVGDVEVGFSQATQIIEGSVFRDAPFHMHMETQNCIAVPREDGMDVYLSAQWITLSQASISKVLGIPASNINIIMHRAGGAFGAKVDRTNIFATASALAAQKFRCPVRIDLDLKTNMTLVGWRDPYYCSYKVGVDASGKLLAVEATLACDTGYISTGATTYGAVSALPNSYSCPNWKVSPVVAITNTASNTSMRAPSTLPGITMMENIMDHVAIALGQDPLEFRRLNFIQDGEIRKMNITCPKTFISLSIKGIHDPRKYQMRDMVLRSSQINDMVDQIIASSDYETRKADIALFNQNNRWHKRGIAIMPMLYPYEVFPAFGFGVIISIYGVDGSVTITHGGAEMGQGIHTKIAQTAAYFLGCNIDKIQVRPTSNLGGANSSNTGGSAGTDCNMHCISEAAKRLKARLDNYDEPTWEEKVNAAFTAGIDLCERYWNGPGEVIGYPIYGVACTEVELDVLTGTFLVSRVDILQDAGTSPNPLIDIGQVEGAFVMGQGQFTTEKPLYDPETGRKLTDGTWLYKPPTCKDIPVDFRVSLLEGTPNPDGVLNSKVTSEPPTCLAFSVPMALRQAVTSARADAGVTGWFAMNNPLTIDYLQELCLVKKSMLTFG